MNRTNLLDDRKCDTITGHRTALILHNHLTVKREKRENVSYQPTVKCATSIVMVCAPFDCFMLLQRIFTSCSSCPGTFCKPAEPPSRPDDVAFDLVTCRLAFRE